MKDRTKNRSGRLVAGGLGVALTASFLDTGTFAGPAVAAGLDKGTLTFTVPATPDAPSVSVDGRNITVAWAAPADGGAPIEEYVITLSDTTSATVEAGRLTHTFVDLPPRTYTATVAAVNEIGSSPASPPSPAVTISRSPVDPSTVHGTVTVTGALVPGGRISVKGSGLAADTAGFRGELHSDPVLLGTVTSDARGAFELTTTVPTATPAGTHRVVVLLEGVEVAASTITIEAAAASGAGALARTGIDVPFWAVGAGILGIPILGLLLLVVRRRLTS
ncbi:fibronectin type III domain-containing protein [Microbacterium sp. GXF7504]